MPNRKFLYTFGGVLMLAIIVSLAWSYISDNFIFGTLYHMSGQVVSVDGNVVKISGMARSQGDTIINKRTVSFKITGRTVLEREKYFIEKKYMLPKGVTGVSEEFTPIITIASGSLDELKVGIAVIDAAGNRDLLKTDNVTAAKIKYRTFEYEK